MKINSLFVLLVLSLLFSCQKEENLEPSPINLLGDSIHISRIYELDSISPTYMDTLSMSHFEYDNLKRLKKISHYDYNYSPQPTITSYMEFKYNGLDSLPWLSDFSSITPPLPGTSYSDSTFYFYNSVGRLRMDSVRFTNGTSQVTIEVPVSGGFKHISRDNFTGGTISDTFTIIQTIQNGHIVKEEQQDLLNSPMIHRYEYDNKTNPFKKLSMGSFSTLFNTSPGYFQGLDNNNMTKYIFEPGLGQAINIMNYTYLPNGLPLMVRVYDNASVPTPPSITLFKYTN